MFNLVNSPLTTICTQSRI